MFADHSDCRYAIRGDRGSVTGSRNTKKEERKIYLPRTITISNKKNKETILKLARSRLPEKQKAIYAGRQHC